MANRDKIVEKFSNKFKTNRKFRWDEESGKGRKKKKKDFSQARQYKQTIRGEFDEED